MSLTIYDAAAGAGKTYTLVKNYLLKLLASPNNSRYKQILAITFTNKAVSEMKERILSTLYAFSLNETDSATNAMFKEIQENLEITPLNLRKRALTILNFILHNYTAFSVQTIDKFTQSIIRTFAFDLNLSNSFEVQLDQKLVLEEAVDQLLMEVGKEETITDVVLKYVAQQIDDDKSWDIKLLLIDLGMLIFSENDRKYISNLSTSTSKDFLKLNATLKNSIQKNETNIKTIADELLKMLDHEEVINDFSRGSLPKYFTKLFNDKGHKLDGFILKDITSESLYTKTKEDSIKAKIDLLRPQIEKAFNETKALIYENKLHEGILKNLPAMSLLSELKKKVSSITKEKNQVLIAEFNSLIAENIKDQPTPFIYERLGEKYKDFFIDEFQDTSEVQWNNLTPLVDNALSSYIENTETTGTATLVGDAKQSIYRWRGGKAEQFITLSNGEHPFSNPETETFQLDTNYRSYSEIINFNNDFFSYLADFLSDDNYKALYKQGNQQKENDKKGGYVSFELFDVKTKAEKNEIYPQAIKKYINEALSDNFKLNDIAVLVRKNADGVTIANYLTKEGIPVISSESLLVKNSLQVQLLQALLNYLSDFKNPVFRLEIIDKLSKNFEKTVDHKTVKSLLKDNKNEFEIALNRLFNIEIQNITLHDRDLYTLLEELILLLQLNLKVSANLQFFMDFVFDYSNNTAGGLVEFLEYWNTKKEKLSISISDTQEGINILSIHKSKGLEFPVVIIPYIEESLENIRITNLWINNPENTTMSNLYWRFNKKVIRYYNENLIQNNESLITLEELDTINVLYVAFTRAEQRLYLISSEKDANLSLEKRNISSILNDLFSLKSKSIDNRYEIGFRKDSNQDATLERTPFRLGDFSNNKTPIKTIAQQNKTKHQEIGEYIHYIMSQIYDRSDLDYVLQKLDYAEILNTEEKTRYKSQITNLLNSTVFKSFFNSKNKIYNERDFSVTNKVLRPDRVEITSQDEGIVLDYKTGKPDPKHSLQIKDYEHFLQKMGVINVNKFIIYFDETLKIAGF